MSLSMRATSPIFNRTILVGSAAVPDGQLERSLLERLAQSLEDHSVRYCQWKGHWSAHRWAAGRGDVDLLVDHDSSADFRRLVGDLGFKPALHSGAREVPGVESYFGYDPAVPRLLHLHVHYRLVVGDFWRTTYRIPIERAMLETSGPGTLFRVPDPTFQYVVFVLRMMFLQFGRPRLALGTRWRRSIQIQLDNLEGLTERQALATVLSRHLPAIDLPFFDRCVASLRGEFGAVERALLPDQLHARLWPYARRPSIPALLTATADKLLPVALRRMLADDRMRPAAGGTVVALVGGDGAGKSTAATELSDWLGTDFATARGHLGNPPRSLFTLAVGGLLKAEQLLHRMLRPVARPASHLELLRYLCTARDCYLLHQRLRRFAADGGVAICERYPVPQMRSHVGPSIPALLPAKPTRLAKRLETMEAEYYGRILAPDALLVLRLDPELAVLRKPDEPADYVRARGRAVWETDWTGTPAHCVDTSRPLPVVLKDLKALVWSAL
jgi:thymidylate kinase